MNVQSSKRVFTGSLLLLLNLYLCLVSQAEEGDTTGRYIGLPQQPLCSSPGGPKKGDLFLGTPVTTAETRGEWIHVTVDGWVRVNSLSSGVPAAYAPASEDDGLITLVSFSVKEVSDGVPRPRLYLRVHLKNRTKEKIVRWSAFLIATYKDQEEELFRETVSDDRNPLPPEGEADVQFYWEVGETPYHVLKNTPSSKLTLKLLDVRSNQ